VAPVVVTDWKISPVSTARARVGINVTAAEAKVASYAICVVVMEKNTGETPAPNAVAPGRPIVHKLLFEVFNTVVRSL